MIKQEWKNILKNHWIQIVLVAIILIPSIYTVVFLGSMWDPYGNSDDLPVAVVNQDEGIEYLGNELAVGKELVNKLKDNKSLDFHFLDENEANDGLENGDYYMVITIPQDFSKNASTLLDDNPEKMVLNYTTNPGTNYVASKMDDSAIAKIKEQVSASVTKTYAETIFNSITTLSNGLVEASDGTNELVNGMEELQAGNDKISSNLKVLANSSLTFKDGSDTLTKGLKDYTDGVIEVDNGVYKLNEGVGELANKTPDLVNGIKELNTGSQSLKAGLIKYTSGVNEALLGSKQLTSNNTTINNGIENLGNGLTLVTTGNQEVVTGLETMQTSINSYLTLINSIDDQTLVNQILTNGLTVEQAMGYGIALDSNIPSATALLNTINTSLNNDLIKGSKSIQVGLNQMNASVNGGSYVDTTGSHEVSEEASLKNGIKSYTNGVTSLQSGLNELVNNNETLITGMTKISAGTSELNDNVPTLSTGVKDLVEGVDKLVKGTSKLVSNNSTLNNGSNSLSAGASKISSGADQLASGSNTLANGLQSAKEGASTLNEALSKGAKDSNIEVSEDTLEMVASPVEVNHKEISRVDNNGHAMAPYMMSVGLYVTCLAFVLMYPIRKEIKNAKNPWKYWLSKASVMYTVSTLGAVVMVTTLRCINGFDPVNLGLTYLLAILVGAAFMSLVMLLSLTTGFIGDFILLVFMIINLGGSAGTYPLETGPSIYKVIHNFVPYTYSVNGFRKAISMTNPSLSVEIMVFIGIFIICSLLTVLYFKVKNKEDKHLIPQMFEEVNSTKD